MRKWTIRETYHLEHDHEKHNCADQDRLSPQRDFKLEVASWLADSKILVSFPTTSYDMADESVHDDWFWTVRVIEKWKPSRSVNESRKSADCRDVKRNNMRGLIFKQVEQKDEAEAMEGSHFGCAIISRDKALFQKW